MIRKHAHGFILTIATICLGTSQTFAQTVNSEISLAVKVLKNIETGKSTEWAVQTLTNAAVNDSSAYAMNCLGLVYMEGIGVDRDSTKAVEWMENAGKNDYAEAYHNLGLMFKYSKCGVKQNFEKSYRYFCAGADRGSVSCMYDKGFMLYKGLGCGQDYKKAIECFNAAAASNHSPSLYMLGLCYRNGYGVEKDVETARNYLSRSASLGIRTHVRKWNEATRRHICTECFLII